MDKIAKALNRLSEKEKQEVKKILYKIKTSEFSQLDLKKLKNHKNIYRIRKNKLRIIFQIKPDNDIYILSIERKSDTTYSF